jgi:FkbM family methyltransferase
VRQIDHNLIYDIGLHKGKDAGFYLAKGFRVVGVEAAPPLCALVAANQSQALAQGNLVIVQRALSETSNEKVSFFINPEKDDWGSLYRAAAEKGVGKAYEISVETITLEDLFAAYGSPYYVKCDIEGADALFIRQLHASTVRPQYVSFELTSVEDLAFLLASGYDNFQIVNQYLLPYMVPPNPPLEGQYSSTQFTHESSGLFGRELPLGGWIDYTTLVRNFMDWSDLRTRTTNLVVGWLDVHARHSTAPAS